MAAATPSYSLLVLYTAVPGVFSFLLTSFTLTVTAIVVFSKIKRTNTSLKSSDQTMMTLSFPIENEKFLLALLIADWFQSVASMTSFFWIIPGNISSPYFASLCYFQGFTVALANLYAVFFANARLVIVLVMNRFPSYNKVNLIKYCFYVCLFIPLLATLLVIPFSPPGLAFVDNGTRLG